MKSQLTFNHVAQSVQLLFLSYFVLVYCFYHIPSPCTSYFCHIPSLLLFLSLVLSQVWLTALAENEDCFKASFKDTSCCWCIGIRIQYKLLLQLWLFCAAGIFTFQSVTFGWYMKVNIGGVNIVPTKKYKKQHSLIVWQMHIQQLGFPRVGNEGYCGWCIYCTASYHYLFWWCIKCLECSVVVVNDTGSQVNPEFRLYIWHWGQYLVTFCVPHHSWFTYIWKV